MVSPSSSKHDGLAGSRFGWALVKDADLAHSMQQLISAIAYCVPVDTELRVLTSLQTILSKDTLNYYRDEIHSSKIL